MQHHLPLFGLVLVAAAGGPSDCYGRMDPGNRCGSCHISGKAPVFGAAGTLYPDANAPARGGLQGATVEVTDRDGQVVKLVTNDVGNFYTTSSLRPPLQVTVSRDGASASMRDAPSGDCNSCHQPGAAPVPGRVHLP